MHASYMKLKFKLNVKQDRETRKTQKQREEKTDGRNKPKKHTKKQHTPSPEHPTQKSNKHKTKQETKVHHVQEQCLFGVDKVPVAKVVNMYHM